MLFGNLPFYGTTENEIIEKILNANIKFPTDIPASSLAKDIIKNML